MKQPAHHPADEGRSGDGAPLDLIRLAAATGPPPSGGDTAPAPIRMEEHVDLRVRPGKLLWTVLAICAALEILFVVLDYSVNYQGGTEIGALRRLTNITREDSLSGWFAPVQTLLVALTLWAIFVIDRRQATNRWRPLGWAVVAAFFTYMAIDDGTGFHERIGTAVGTLYRRGGAGTTGGVLAAFPSYAWQVVFVPGLAVLGVFTLLFLRREIRDRPGRALVLAGLGCFAVAVGLDFVEGLRREHPLNLQTWLIDRLDLYAGARRHFGRSAHEVMAHFSKSLEETLEALGTTLLWIAVLRHLMHRAGEVRIRFATSPERGLPRS